MANNRKKSFVYRDVDGYRPDGDSTDLCKPITVLGLHSDTVTKLQSANINTLSELASIEMRHAYRIDNMNRKDVFAALRVLHTHKLDFKRNPNAHDDAGAEGANADGTDFSPEKRSNRDNSNDKVASDNATDTASGQPRRERNNRNDRRNDRKATPSDGAVTGDTANAQGEGAAVVTDMQARAPRDNRNNRNNRSGDNRVRESGDNRRPREDRPRSTDRNVQAAPVAANGQPPREKINTHDFLRGKLNGDRGDRRDKNNSRDRNNSRDNNHDNRNSRGEKLPPAKRVIELPPLVIADGLYKYYQQGKWGYKDTAGKIMIEPQFDEAYNFSEGMAGVELGERLGFINTQGEVVIDYQFDTICSFSEGLASVTKDDKSAYITKEGEYEWAFEFESATSFAESISLVKKDGKWGYLNRQTREIRLR